MAEDRIYDVEDWERARDHSWRYFSLHAGQRMTTFNFFVVLSGIITAGIGAAIQGPPRLAVFGILLGIIMVLLSFVFWKLDQRSSFLIKHSEAAVIRIERELLPSDARLFSLEPTQSRAAGTGSGILAPWTFGRSLRTTFLGMALVGAAAMAICSMRVCGALTWEEANATITVTADRPASGQQLQEASE